MSREFGADNDGFGAAILPRPRLAASRGQTTAPSRAANDARAAGRYGFSSWLLPPARGVPMWIVAGWIELCVAAAASEVPAEPIATV